jgi:1,4-dihydroxy-2-naphthoyl-CoA hydrolase
VPWLGCIRALGGAARVSGDRQVTMRPVARVGHTVAVAPPAPYDAQNFLQLLGIDVPMPEEDRDMVARLTVSHALIAGTGFLWAPVVIAMADALCAFGVSRHWPEGARSFTTLNCSSQFLSSAREGEQVTATAAPLHLGRSTQVWDATVLNDTTERLMASYRCTQMILY